MSLVTADHGLRTKAAPDRSGRPRVLLITSELPWPLNTGGHLRTFHLLKALVRSYEVRVVTVVDCADDPGLAELEQIGARVRPAIPGPRRRLSEAAQVARAALRGEPYVMFHRHNRAALRLAVDAEFRSFQPDVVYLDHLDPLAFRPLFPQSVLVADLHNIYSKLAARVAEERSGPARFYLRREARLLADIERRIAREATVLMAVSREEQQHFESIGTARVHLVPNGVDCGAFRHMPVGRPSQPPVLLYLGALSWQPNARAAEFLAREVMPDILRAHPDARLQIVGRSPGPDVLALQHLPGVEVHASVPDIGVYLRQASLLAVPLDSGGGTRLKILEAFAAGLPVVSTPVGCEGIDCEHGRHLLVAERDRFADAILQAVDAPGLMNSFAEEGRRLVEAAYDWSVIGQSACAAVREAVTCRTSRMDQG